MTTGQFYAGLALAQAMPGPLFNFAAYLGAVIAMNAGVNAVIGGWDWRACSRTCAADDDEGRREGNCAHHTPGCIQPHPAICCRCAKSGAGRPTRNPTQLHPPI